MGRNPVARHEYSFSRGKNQRFDFAENHRVPQFLEIGIKNNGLSRGAGSGPAFHGSGRRRPGEVKGKERSRQWHPPPRRGRQESSAATAPSPSRKCPAKLEAILEPQVPRGCRGVRDWPPHPRARRGVVRRARTRREVSCRRGDPVAGRAGAGWGRRGARGVSGGAPSPPSRSPSPAPPFVPRDLRRPRAAGAAELGRRRRLRGSPCRLAEEEKPWCCGEGTRLAEGRLRQRGEGEPTDPAPGAGRGRSRGCGESRGGLRDAREAAQPSSTAPKAAQVTAESKEDDWRLLRREGWCEPEAGPRDPEAASAGPARPRTPARCLRDARGLLSWLFNERRTGFCGVLSLAGGAGQRRIQAVHPIALLQPKPRHLSPRASQGSVPWARLAPP
ncbi:uncharacterized protein LOC118150646 [Callithrix jacchus]|uniref:translation initiation factor IF-2-like n=1 Tax=Callithrix jacchus TaxID=9483 RepID=UPI0023DD47FF|nr:translation initiation factor IF-2-like [Callithrix jacchus]